MNKPMIDTSLIVDCLEWFIKDNPEDGRNDDIRNQIAYLQEPDPILSMDAVRKLGALQVEYERSQGVDHFLASQRQTYARHTREDLEEELLRRDRTLVTEGRNLGNQKMTGNLLRELMRGILVQADLSALKQISADAKGGNIIGILEALGAAPADKRQLRLMGTTLGDLSKTTEEREAEMEALAAGTLAHTDDTTAGSARVGDAIREHRKEHVPDPVPAVSEADKRPCQFRVGLTTCGYQRDDVMHNGSPLPESPHGYHRHDYQPEPDRVSDR